MGNYSGYCWVSRLPVQPNLRGVKCQHDFKPSILENRPTEMIQVAQTLGAIGLNMPAASNLRYWR